MSLTRAAVLEAGVSKILEQWGGGLDVTESCRMFLEEAVSLRRRANHQ